MKSERHFLRCFNKKMKLKAAGLEKKQNRNKNLKTKELC